LISHFKNLLKIMKFNLHFLFLISLVLRDPQFHQIKYFEKNFIFKLNFKKNQLIVKIFKNTVFLIMNFFCFIAKEFHFPFKRFIRLYYSFFKNFNNLFLQRINRKKIFLKNKKK
jgi:hypothetical protein